MNNTEYINSIYKKIRIKKIKNKIYTSSIGAVSICFILFLNYNLSSKSDHLHNNIINDLISIEVYEWEYIEELNEIEILTYLIDKENEFEFIELANNSLELIEALKSIEIKEKL